MDGVHGISAQKCLWECIGNGDLFGEQALTIVVFDSGGV